MKSLSACKVFTRSEGLPDLVNRWNPFGKFNPSHPSPFVSWVNSSTGAECHFVL